MATPTLPEIQAQINAAVHLLDETALFGFDNTPNYIDLENTLIEAMESDYSPEWLQAASVARGYLDSLVKQAPALLSPGIQTLGQYIEAPERDVAGIIERWREYADENGILIQGRDFTFGTPTASGANIGSGTCLRLCTDRWGYCIENQHADAKRALCVADRQSGATQHEELFEFRGQTAPKDSIELSGSGKVQQVKALSASDSNSYLGNASFESYSGELTTLTALTNWEVTGNIANLNLSETVYYRGWGGIETPRSLEFLASDTITQAFSEQGASFSPDTPYICQIAYNVEATVSGGSITLSMGTQDVTALLASGAGAGWQILRLPVDANSWFDNFNETDAEFSIAVATLAGGSVYVDDMIVAPMTKFDGGWYAVVGAATAFLRGDVFDWADTETGAKIQTWLHRAFDTYWPHALGGGITWADPT